MGKEVNLFFRLVFFLEKHRNENDYGSETVGVFQLWICHNFFCFSFFLFKNKFLNVSRTIDSADKNTEMTTEEETKMSADDGMVEIVVRDELRHDFGHVDYPTEYVYRVRKDATIMDLKEAICRGDEANGVPPGPAPQQITLYVMKAVEGKDGKPEQKMFTYKHTEKLGMTFCLGEPNKGRYLVFALLHKYFA